MARLTEDAATRLAARSAHRRADGSRGPRARLAWRRLVRACAQGDLAAQDAVRSGAAELPEADVLDLLAAGPREPADRAAYLGLVGQGAQRQALDPDGTLLALAYRAASQEVRERLRTMLATEADPDVIRVVVTGEQRDRIAEMSPTELDYLGHHLAEHHRFDDLRRLALDLPLAEAVAAARLLPADQRAYDHGDLGDDGPGTLAALAEQSARLLRGTIERLPRDHLITHTTPGDRIRASFSPDTSELALKCGIWRHNSWGDFTVEILHIGTGRATREVAAKSPGTGFDDAILHLGTEIVVRLMEQNHTHSSVVRVLPDWRTLCPADVISGPRRVRGGAVLLRAGGLAFADTGADVLRYVGLPPYGGQHSGKDASPNDACSALATLPESGRIAIIRLNDLLMLSDNGKVVLHSTTLTRGRQDGKVFHDPALTFVSPHAVALHQFVGTPGNGTAPAERTEAWEFPRAGKPRRTAMVKGAARELWPLERWRAAPLDDRFAARLLSSPADPVLPGTPDVGLPWPFPSAWRGGRPRAFLSLAPWGDMLATSLPVDGRRGLCEVHSPHLPLARELLERPLLHHGPQDVQRVRALRAAIGDPAVRHALDLLAGRLADRFGGDIALAGGTPTVGATPGGTDIALGEDGTAG